MNEAIRPLTRSGGRRVRCAIYTRKSQEQGLDQEFNSLQAQREACEAYIASHKHEGWRCLPDRYDDGGVSGATLQRPALQQLLADIQGGRIDVIVVYKVDRLTRALSDFARIVEVLERYGVSFVSVTQQFNRLQKEWHVDGRPPAPRLRRAGPEVGCQRDGGGDCPSYLPPVP